MPFRHSRFEYIHRDKEHKVGKAHSVIELGNVTFMLVKASPEHKLNYKINMVGKSFVYTGGVSLFPLVYFYFSS